MENETVPVEQEESFFQQLQNFFSHSITETDSGIIQVFHSFTYGEMVISFLLLCIVMVMVFKWLWEVFRY